VRLPISGCPVNTITGGVSTHHRRCLQVSRLAEEAMIIATPTLIKELPPPLRRVFDDLSDTTERLNGLGIPPSGPSATGRLAVRPRDDAPS